ncbi:MAG: hypothetical protein KF718_14745 [Polyangiaceae bacterium]|nr:hypothetical protein [Polyangiaceae bacterium]
MLPLLCITACSAAVASGQPGLTDAEWQRDGGAPQTSEPAPEPDRSDELDPAARLREVAIAVGPGVIVHGLGQHRAGRPEAARKLLVAEAVGLGLTAVGLSGLALTGASRYTVAPLALTTMAGVGLFATSWLTDVYAVARPAGSEGAAPRFAPRLVSEMGYRHVADPQFPYRHFLMHRFELRVGKLALEPSGWFALDENNARLRLAARYRLAGATPGRPCVDGTFWDLELAGTHHRYDHDGFRIATGEASTRVRLDLARRHAAFRGAFVQGGAGFALQRTAYDVPAVSIPADWSEMLLGELGFGFYFGEPARYDGEVRLFYDHRHDGYAAGMLMPGLGSGVIGHLGLDAVGFFGEQLGLRAEAQVGAAVVTGLSLVVRERRH